MEASWQNELRTYWRIIENEAETLLKHDCIKDDMLFDNGFKVDFLQEANKKYHKIPKQKLFPIIPVRTYSIKFTNNIYLITESETHMKIF